MVRLKIIISTCKNCVSLSMKSDPQEERVIRYVVTVSQHTQWSKLRGTRRYVHHCGGLWGGGQWAESVSDVTPMARLICACMWGEGIKIITVIAQYPLHQAYSRFPGCWETTHTHVRVTLYNISCIMHYELLAKHPPFCSLATLLGKQYVGGSIPWA